MNDRSKMRVAYRAYRGKKTIRQITAELIADTSQSIYPQAEQVELCKEWQQKTSNIPSGITEKYEKAHIMDRNDAFDPLRTGKSSLT